MIGGHEPGTGMIRPMQKLTATTRRRPTGSVRAFTLTELLVVIGLTAMLGAVLLSASFTTQERVMRAQCVNNLRQIGVGMNLYSADANGYVPICGWPQGQNPWQTAEACRVDIANSTNVTRGFYSLGLLFRTKIVADAKTFYCPGTALISRYQYDYYATPPNSWPSSPIGSGDDNIDTGYHYYPQLRVTERSVNAFGIFYLPKLTYSGVQFEIGGFINTVTPAKLSELDPKKSIATDLVNYTSVLSHRSSGAVAGLNAVFPDGRVVFQNARTDTRSLYSSPWYYQLWKTDPGSTPDTFRIIMNNWRP
jgi:type II secretory pathway pseudopilin PulG